MPLTSGVTRVVAGVQRDLKPQNLLLSTHKSGALLKIADFGFARSLQPQVAILAHVLKAASKPQPIGLQRPLCSPPVGS